MTTKSKNYSRNYLPIKPNIFFENDILNRVSRETIKDIRDITQKLKSGELSFSYGGRPIKARPSDVLRVISQKPYNDSLKLCYRNIILNYVFSLEQLSVYSGFAFLDILFSKNRKFKAKSRSTIEEAEFLVRNYMGDGICFEIVSNIVRNAGLFCDTFTTVNHDKSEERFKVKFEEMFEQSGNFSSAFLSRVENLKNCSIIFVEGKIERVSEIHRLLETAGEIGRKVVIISYGFHTDVSHTLCENFKSGKLKVVPFEVSQEITGEDFENLGVFSIMSDNTREISLVSIEDLENNYNVSFKRGNIRIEGLKGVGRVAHISIPHHFSSQAGLIEDRINSGVIFCQQISKHGIVTSDIGVPLYGLFQYKNAVNALRSFDLSSDNIGCVVTHDA